MRLFLFFQFKQIKEQILNGSKQLFSSISLKFLFYLSYLTGTQRLQGTLVRKTRGKRRRLKHLFCVEWAFLILEELFGKKLNSFLKTKKIDLRFVLLSYLTITKIIQKEINFHCQNSFLENILGHISFLLKTLNFSRQCVKRYLYLFFLQKRSKERRRRYCVNLYPILVAVVVRLFYMLRLNGGQ